MTHVLLEKKEHIAVATMVPWEEPEAPADDAEAE